MKTLTDEQVLQIIDAGIADRITIDYSKTAIMNHNGVYRLYNKEKGFKLLFPNETIVAIMYDPEADYVQFSTKKHYVFNHLAAIKKMQELRLV